MVYLYTKNIGLHRQGFVNEFSNFSSSLTMIWTIAKSCACRLCGISYF